ncbi:MAG: hypothetical protein A3I61_08275 [Acidobacteria bacterium RIFCSPLOWO2_02_FULL_68_18]|nr:MAG: hypothetical protein A3I61_08275 [Acidobacteria bacterium RIFCSPLOWO2_02_FULL_68_18]OFW51236.1 MAG: hypothetical protein A3G77_06370 [Acidobacteria bacterium RIFCSPLOWO2_12_FULL_68_19]
MTRYLGAAVAVALFAGAAPVGAHHSFAATYVENQSITIEGEIVQFLLRNPHSFVHVMVKEPDGTQQRYVVEWGAPAQLAEGKVKVSRDTIKPGDHVIITGNPGRNASDRRIRMLTFQRPSDGWSWGLLPNEKFN